MKNLKKLTDEELFLLASTELIELVKKYRDGDEHAFEKAVYVGELKRRGLKLEISTNLIHRIFTGEFDNADGIEAKVTKVGEN